MQDAERTAPGTPRALDVGDVSLRVGYQPRRIRQLVRQGLFPTPISQVLPARSWRWAETDIDTYCLGGWDADAEDGAA